MNKMKLQGWNSVVHDLSEKKKQIYIYIYIYLFFSTKELDMT